MVILWERTVYFIEVARCLGELSRVWSWSQSRRNWAHDGIHKLMRRRRRVPFNLPTKSCDSSRPGSSPWKVVVVVVIIMNRITCTAYCDLSVKRSKDDGAVIFLLRSHQHHPKVKGFLSIWLLLLCATGGASSRGVFCLIFITSVRKKGLPRISLCRQAYEVGQEGKKVFVSRVK